MKDLYLIITVLLILNIHNEDLYLIITVLLILNIHNEGPLFDYHCITDTEHT